MQIVSFILIYFLKYFYEKNKNKMMKIKNKKIKEFIKHCIFSNLIFFNFGYQVHEKAFLNISILTLIYYIISIPNEEKKENEDKKEKIKKNIKFDIINSLSFIIIIIGIFAQLPLIHEASDYLVKTGLTIFYIVICKAIIFKNNDINSLLIIMVLIFGYIIFSLILDFLITFQKYFDYDIQISFIMMLKEINEKYPFLFLMLYSIFNGAFTQIIFILLFIL